MRPQTYGMGSIFGGIAFLVGTSYFDAAGAARIARIIRDSIPSIMVERLPFREMELFLSQDHRLIFRSRTNATVLMRTTNTVL